MGALFMSLLQSAFLLLSLVHNNPLLPTSMQQQAIDAGNQILSASVNDSLGANVNAVNVNAVSINTSGGTIQGILSAVTSAGVTTAPPTLTVTLDKTATTASATSPYSYSFSNVSFATHTLSLTAPAGWSVKYTLCFFTNTVCTGTSFAQGSSTSVALPSGESANVAWYLTQAAPPPPAKPVTLNITNAPTSLSGTVGSSAITPAPQWTATGGTIPYTWSVASGSLPPGITLQSGTPTATLIGTPTTANAYTFALQVHDSATTQQATTTPSITFTVHAATPPPPPPPPPPATGTNNATYDAANSTEPPAFMTPGQTLQVKEAFINSGTTTWTAAGSYKLGSQNPQNTNEWITPANDRVLLAASDSIAPGQEKIFTFTITAPKTAGTYNFEWEMLQEGVRSFGNTSQNVIVTVGSIPTTGLRNLPNASKVFIGAAVGYQAFAVSAPYDQTVAREFNIETPENDMLFAAVHPTSGMALADYNFAAADADVNFALANGMKVRGHTLVWQDGNPGWLTDQGYTGAQLSAILQNHIATVVGHFKGKIYAWDVVNEGMGDNGLPRPSIWSAIGSNYMDLAFEWAHQADPSAKLCYNDYGLTSNTVKANAVYNMIVAMLKQGVPINCIGFEMHVPQDNLTTTPAALFNRFAALGLEIQVTEMTVPIPTVAVNDTSDYQYVLGACLAVSNCKSFETWEVADDVANNWSLLFNDSYQPNPAYTQVQTVLSTPQ